MNKMLIVWCAASLLFGVSAVARGQNFEEHGKLMESLAQQIHSVLQADNVLGAPRDFAGTTIVPTVSLVFGFGSCSGCSPASGGLGLGGGGGVRPEGLLVISKDGEVQVIAAKKGGLTDILEAVLPVVIKSLQDQKEKED